MKELMELVKQSGIIHFPLPIDDSQSIEKEYAEKTILEKKLLWNGKTLEEWRFTGEGEATVKNNTLCLTTGARADHWPETEVRSRDAKKGKYATFGSYEAKLDVSMLNLSVGNRLHFMVKPDCDGLHSPVIRAAFINDGNVKIPDRYSREGFTCMNLVNHEWNDMTWEIDSIAHDKIIEVSFIIHRYGAEISTGETLNYQIKDIYFERIDEPTVKYGWQCQKNTAVFPSTGFFAKGLKIAVANTEAKTFEVVDEKNGDIVFIGETKEVKNHLGSFKVFDFSPLNKESQYYLQFGGNRSSSFLISSSIAESSIWKLLNFFFCERCGCPVPGKHGTCHQDVIATHEDRSVSCGGGWHDAADVSQELVQSGETVQALLDVANVLVDTNPLLYKRLLEEANWGLDYILRTRFSDGFRVTGFGIRRWTDNKIGTFDDEVARVRTHSFINFQMANIEAYSATAFKKEDGELAWKCQSAAQEDYDFALKRFRVIGLETAQPDGHVSTASLSQYYAVAALAAARLYSLTGEQKYEKDAREFAQYIMDSQEDGSSNLPMKGFFYRDRTKKIILHSSHQSRDYILSEALVLLCRTFPNSSDKEAWENALQLHGDYLKELMKYASPYGMIPAGVHRDTELDDREIFSFMNRDVDFDRERKNYDEQLKSSLPLGKGCYVRSFPIWFSFRGNTTVLLSQGKDASLIGDYFGDEALLQIGREQLYWTLGKNPFGQSLIYGEGKRYGQNYTALLGETTGEIAVGVQTKANEDVPYWPAGCVATYREVWLSSPTKWLMLVSDILKNN